MVARYIVFVAPQEWENDMVRIKDLRADYTDKDEEKQIDVKISDLRTHMAEVRAHVTDCPRRGQLAWDR